jgi:hypothetical protein
MDVGIAPALIGLNVAIILLLRTQNYANTIVPYCHFLAVMSAAGWKARKFKLHQNE